MDGRPDGSASSRRPAVAGDDRDDPETDQTAYYRTVVKAYLTQFVGAGMAGAHVDRALAELSAVTGRGNGSAADAASVRKAAQNAGLDALEAELQDVNRRIARAATGRRQCGAIARRLRERANGQISARELDALYQHLGRCQTCAGIAGRFEASEWYLQVELGSTRPGTAQPAAATARQSDGSSAAAGGLEHPAPARPQPEPKSVDPSPDPPVSASAREPEPPVEPEPEQQAGPAATTGQPSASGPAATTGQPSASGPADGDAAPASPGPAADDAPPEPSSSEPDARPAAGAAQAPSSAGPPDQDPPPQSGSASDDEKRRGGRRSSSTASRPDHVSIPSGRSAASAKTRRPTEVPSAGSRTPEPGTGGSPERTRLPPAAAAAVLTSSTTRSRPPTRLIVGVIILVLAAGGATALLSGGGSKRTPGAGPIRPLQETRTNATTATTEPSAPVVHSTVQSFVVAGARFAVYDNGKQAWAAFARRLPPAAGKRWVLVTVQVRNLTRLSFDPRVFHYRLIARSGDNYFPDPEHGTTPDVRRPPHPIPRGTLVQAELAFQVPASATNLQLAFDPTGMHQRVVVALRR